MKGRLIFIGWLASHQARASREDFDFEFLSLLCRFVLSSQPGAVKANMFEHVAAQRIVRVYEPPGWLDKTKVPRRGGKEGALLFGYLILGKQNKVTSCRAAPGDFEFCG